MKNHNIILLFLVCFQCQILSGNINPDTIPYIIKTHIDTVTIVDTETFEETVNVVEWDEYLVHRFDTTVIYNPKTKVETIKVVKDHSRLSDYVKYYLDKYRIENQNHDVELDTIIVFDSENYEETFNVIPRIHPCFYLGWGSRAFTTDSSLSQREFRKNIRKPLNIWALSRNCKKTPDFSFSFLFSTKAGSARIFNVSKENNTLPDELIPEEWIESGARIIIHDIRIDQDDSMDDIIIKVN